MSKIYTSVYVEESHWKMKKFCRETFGPSGFIKGNVMPWRQASKRCWVFKDSAHAVMFSLKWSGTVSDS